MSLIEGTMIEELNFRDIVNELRELGLRPEMDVIAHVKTSAVGPVQGGTKTLAGAIMASCGTLMMPAFTYQTMIVPRVGPPDNALEYGTYDEQNARAEFFRPDLPIHPDIGSVAESLRSDNESVRSVHPIYSFVAQGGHAEEIIAAQSLEDLLGPIGWLADHDGYVLLWGADHRDNFSLHLAERRAGRRTFVRWALTLDDIEELPNIPGCSEGFNAIWEHLQPVTRTRQIGLTACQLISLDQLLSIAAEQLAADPNFLLCGQPGCERCRLSRR
jgi:aminoglycoside 3-N-acetyltransferase